MLNIPPLQLNLNLFNPSHLKQYHGHITFMIKISVPGKPVSLTFWNVTYTSLDMQWVPPLQPNGIIIKYKLTYQEQNSARTY
jgi:hypothetical protein